MTVGHSSCQLCVLMEVPNLLGFGLPNCEMDGYPFLTGSGKAEKKWSMYAPGSSGLPCWAPRTWRHRVASWGWRPVSCGQAQQGLASSLRGLLAQERLLLRNRPFWVLILKRWHRELQDFANQPYNLGRTTVKINTKYLRSERWQEYQTLFVKILRIISILRIL